VLLVTKKGWQCHSFPTNTLIKKVAGLRTLLSSPTSKLEPFIEISNQLYTDLIAPVSKSLEGIEDLIIIPDGVLSALPFEILLTEKTGSEKNFGDLAYLFWDYQITYAFSLATLKQQRSQSSVGRNIAFLGFAPSFENSGAAVLPSRACERNTLAPLLENAKEVKAIQNILGGKIAENTVASKQNFLSKAGKAKIIHLATHACVDDNEPARSRIFFTDDHLYVHELYNLPLQADMVVLSACETGVGNFRRGEGVMSLARGFAASGAPSLTLSYWSVSDQSTSEIMQFYYQALKEGKPKHQALQAAKKDYLLGQEDVRSLHPYYWAPFVHFGDYSSLRKNSFCGAYCSLRWLAVILVLLLGLWIWKSVKARTSL
jgi:CHAT domain-containing protein